jgi:hypothetical protein
VDRNDNSLNSYAYLDSQRLKDAFFSPPKKKRKKRNPHKRFLPLPILIGIVIALTLVAIFSTKYEFMVVARKSINLEKIGISLLRPDNLLELNFLGKDKQLMRKNNSFVYLSIPPQEKIGIELNLKKPIDLAKQTLCLYLKPPDAPLNIEVIVKDAKFFSNSLSPLLIEVYKEDGPYLKVPVDFKNANIQNTNLARITQVKIYFSHKNQESMNRALIKGIILAKGGNQ